MPVSQKNLKHQEEKQDTVLKKNYPVSVGTVVFLVFSFLLIVGFCKFSFYVLKNHRSAVDRDVLVKTYVDVQPYSGRRTEKSSYIVLRNQDKTAPAPFFVRPKLPEDNKKTKTDSSLFEPAPQPVLAAAAQKPAVLTPTAKTVKRPPVIRTAAAVIPDASKQNKEKESAVANALTEDVPLDHLMTSGLTLLAKSDESIMASEFLLQEDPEEAPKTEKPEQQRTPLTTAVVDQGKSKSVTVRQKPKSEEKKKLPAKKAEKKKQSLPQTRWVDIAQLRRQLSVQTEIKKNDIKKDDIRKKNAALLEMNDSRQTAFLNTQITSDVAPQTAPSAVLQKGNDKKTEKQKAPESQPISQKADSLQQNAIQTAVVQDIPFAGTAETPQTAKSVKETSFLAGDSPSLWKIAKARGKPKNTLAPKHEETETKEATGETAGEKTEKVSETASVNNKPMIIYRDGEVSAVIQNEPQKSLNWLDRQQAAVWTSMSQSDTPSVWSPAADATGAADRAKAFRVAEEQTTTPQKTENAPASTPTGEAPQDNVINSQPVRIVGEEQKPQAKTDPLLLPLGAPAPSTTSPATPAPAAAPVIAAGPPPKVNPGGLSAALSSPTKTETEEKKDNDNGLVDKLFSFFGKAETDSLPNIGSGTPADSSEKDKNKDKKNASKIGKQKTDGTTALRPSERPVTQQTDRQIVPTELRLTFKPGSSEMSAQSVKWVKAFGQRAKKDIQNAVEVRMSNIDPDLQEERFALIHSTLTGVGMEDVQVIPVLTDRTPHTIVLRMIVLPEEGYTEYTTEAGGIKERLYYKKW